MENMQIFPFERNRYYMGKMLTSADFQAEQLYINNKRRFLNTMLFGSGIVYGMSVFNLDDLSILVESGMALDELGREIVIENSVVRKLSAIPGFEKLTDDRISLCVRYKEEEVHPVYSMQQENEQEYEYNRIVEGYELFLINTAGLPEGNLLESEFLQQEQVYRGEAYEIMLEMPAVVCVGKQVRLCLKAEKHSEEDKKLDFCGTLQLPAYMKCGGAAEVKLDFQGVSLEAGGQAAFDYWIQVEESESGESSIVMKPDTAQVWVDGEEQELSDEIQIKLKITKQEPEHLIQTVLSKNSLEMREAGKQNGYVRLADFSMIHTGSAFIINDVQEEGVKKYIPAPGKIPETVRYLSYFKEGGSAAGAVAPPESEGWKGERRPHSTAKIARGTMELPLDANMKKGDICYSEEILHGLGKGNVYVAVGEEFQEENSTVYGETSFFRTSGNCTHIRTAVKVYHDRGSFQVAAKLTGEQKTVVVELNWIAIRFSASLDKETQEEADRAIAADPPTAVLGVKEKYYFNVRFRGMQPSRLIYELTEEGTGTITQDGMYTAPSREGIYEIRISCGEDPKISTYAYAVVKKHPGK